MKELEFIKKTELYSVYRKTIDIKKYDFEAIINITNDYLDKNKISGEKYHCESVSQSDFSNDIEVRLSRVGEYGIDEDFDSDKEWDDFCSLMADKLDVRRYSVPYWYYPK